MKRMPQANVSGRDILIEHNNCLALLQRANHRFNLCAWQRD